MTTLTEADALDGLRDALGLLKDREQVAERLLASSAKHSFDPDKELDWDAPFEEGKWFWPPELVSLYDTPLWKRMGEEQRILLSQHEAAALASLGIWFELILMQLLVRHIYDKAATSAHVRYALTEIEDECRHSKMFARLISRGDAPWYPVARVHQNLGRLFKTISTTPGSFTATLAITSAARGSAHQIPAVALRRRPMSSATERYAQSSVCEASLTVADDPSWWPTRRLTRARSGIVTVVKAARPIPIQLASGCWPPASVRMDSTPT